MAGQGDEAEDVGFELAADLFILALFDGGEVAVASIIHEHIDAAKTRFGIGNGPADGLLTGDIEGQCERGFRILISDILDLFRLAGGKHHALTAGEYLLGKLTAEAGGATGDEPDL
jgi:hypothetical protein